MKIRDIELRDFFIANAPAEPPEWFQPVMTTQRPVQPVGPTNHTLTPEERDDDAAWHAGALSLDEMRDHRVKQYHLAHVDFIERSSAWDEASERERYLQWPATWADEMLTRRTA